MRQLATAAAVVAARTSAAARAHIEHLMLMHTVLQTGQRRHARHTRRYTTSATSMHSRRDAVSAVASVAAIERGARHRAQLHVAMVRLDDVA